MNFAKFLPRKWIYNLSTIWGLGFIGRCPGTNGTFVGLVIYTLFFYNMTVFNYFFWTISFVLFGISICGEAEIIFHKKDPVCAILDEVVVIPICFIGLQDIMHEKPMWIFILLGGVIFRFFDIIKPLGINKLQELKGGIGIVIDDLVAAVYTCICLHIIVHFWFK